MATITISNLDSDGSNLLSELTDKEAETLLGGMLPTEPGGRRRPLEIPPLPPPTRPFDPTLGF
jgi:hypothetical protein